MTKGKLALTVATVVVVLAAVAAAVVITNRSGPPSAASCDIPSSVPVRPESAATAPGGGGIQVAEHGFSLSNSLLSVGVILRNTSDRIAYRTKVAFSPFLTVGGGAPKPPETPLLATEIPVLLPGQEIGVGRGMTFGSGPVGAVDIDVQTTTWLTRDALGSSFVSPETKFDRTIRYPPDASTAAVLYHENDMNCRPLADRRTAVVFRDATGAIIGGALADPDGRGNQVGDLQAPSSPSCTPGSRDTWIAPPGGIPQNVDDSRTRLYSYCDLEAPPGDVNAQF